jgi:flagellar hook protein FlgE
MIGSLWTGISGLSTHQAALDNESHNIANVNTIGYKSSRISFADQMYQDAIGKGSKVLEAEKIFSQGNIKTTGVSYDVALEGSGFLVVKDPNATGSSEEYFTRAGNLRMGENGTLQDANLYDVIGWTIAPVTSDDIESTNPNISRFTNDYVKIAANQIVQKNSSIETISAKLTDYTESAHSDASDVLTGLGMKSMSTKITDVELLITDYQEKLKEYANDPEANSSPSLAQKSIVELPGSSSGITSESDQVYVYINGEKISQNYIETSTSIDLDGDGNINTDGTNIDGSDDLLASRIATYQALADQISNIPGYRAYIADPALATSTNPTYQRVEGDINNTSTLAQAVTANPVLVIESIIPGEEFVIGDAAEYIASSNSLVPGSSTTISQAQLGTGMGAVESARDALLELAAGFQRDVWSEDEMPNAYPGDTLTFEIANPDDSNNPFSLSISIDDTGLADDVVTYDDGTTLTLSADMSEANKIDMMVEAINGHPEMAKYVKAHNYNGNLVVETINSAPGDTFNAAFKSTDKLSSSTIIDTASSATVADGSTLDVDFTGNLNADERLSVGFSFNGNTYMGYVDDSGTANATAYYSDDNGVTWTAVALGAPFASETAADINTAIDAILSDVDASLTSSIVGNIVTVDNSTGGGVSLTGLTITKDVIVAGNLNKSTTLSINSGADAEFISMINKLDQTASRTDLQLRLDNLGISDSAFGDFSVDSTGLITMKQDGVEFAVGQMSIAMFNNERGLQSEGNNLMSKTSDSGSPIYNVNNDKAASVAGKALELSTADLSESLVNLMVFQRAFEANSKSITTSDQILTTLIQLKK